MTPSVVLFDHGSNAHHKGPPLSTLVASCVEGPGLLSTAMPKTPSLVSMVWEAWEIFFFEVILQEDRPGNSGRSGCGAIQEALENEATTDKIRTLATEFPQDLQKKMNGYLPLHLAILKRRWDAVQVLLEASPQTVMTKGEDGSLPLHWAATLDPPMPVVELLVTEHPCTVRMRAENGWIPLHHAVADGRRLDVVQLLLDMHKRGLRVKCKRGLLPLHVAAIHGVRMDIAQLIAGLYPRALHEESSCGMLPLHYAAANSRLELVEFFANKNPKALVRKSAAGCLPLQEAVQNDAQAEVVDCLARMTGACRVMIAFLSDIVRTRHQCRQRPLLATKLQATARRFLVQKQYGDAIRTRVRFAATGWSEAVALAPEPGLKIDSDPDSDWASLRERSWDMERSLRADLLQKFDEAVLECSSKGNGPVNGEGTHSTASGDCIDDDEYVPFKELERTLRNPPRVTNRVLLTSDVLKWSRVSDPKYVEFFVRRIQQLASGQRSRVLAKRLKGNFRAAIFETYLEQKSGHRILWTVEALGEVLVWNVVKHKEVSRFARLIGSSLGRTKRQVSDALSTLGVGSVVESASSHADAIVLDPLGNTPLKLYTVHGNHAQKLADPSWTPPLRLTQEERAAVESTGTTLVLGRSGTGKTICLCNKIEFDRYISGADDSFKQLFVSRSDRLCRFVKKVVPSDNCAFTTFQALLSNVESAVSTEVRFRSSQRVDFKRFKRDFYRSSKVWGDVDALVVWTNIQTFIKGSIDSLSSPGRILSIEDYVSLKKLGKKRCRLSPDHRYQVYNAFRAYSKYLAENGLWDDCDRISHLLETLQDLKVRDPERIETLRHSKLYVDECQDFTQAEILLFFYLSRSGDLFLCGDPAQSVVEGVQFRFNEIRSVAHFVAGADRRHLIPEKPMKLNVNFRSHSGVVNMAAAVLKRMFTVFPDTASQLDRGIFVGPRPGVLYNVKADLLSGALSSVLNGSTVLVHDEHETSCRQILGGYKLLHGIREAKGLEFKSVIVLDFFAGIPHALQKTWRDLLLGREGPDFASRFPEVEGHLKLLYTAITRSVDRLLFVESQESIAGEAFRRWCTTTTTRVRSRDEEPLAVTQEISGIEAFEMSVTEWMLAGFDNAETAEAKDDLNSSVSFFAAALHCFQKAGHSRFIAKAQANLASVRFRLQMRIGVKSRSNANMTEQAMAELLSRLLREELWVEAAKFCLAALPHLPGYAQSQLRENLLPKLPRV